MPTTQPTATARITQRTVSLGQGLVVDVPVAWDLRGVGFVNQDPHVFYLMVESDHLDWTLSAEEAVAGTATGEPRR